MLSNFFKKSQTANIVIKDHVIRHVRIRLNSPLHVKSCGEHYLPNGVIRDGKITDRETLEMILEECVEEWGLKNSPLNFIVPDPYIVIRKVQIPVDLSETEISGHLYMEIGNTIHLPFEDAVFDFTILTANSEKQEILLFAAPEQVVFDYSDLFEDVDLKPQKADISPLSIYRLYSLLGKNNPNNHLLILQFDLKTVNASIFHQHRPEFMRHLKMDLNHDRWERKKNDAGIEKLTWTGSQEELTGELEDMYGEIERLNNFYRFSVHQGKKGVNQILLTGDHPDFETIKNELTGRFDVSVDTIDESKLSSSDGAPLDPNMYLALGLALKEVK